MKLSHFRSIPFLRKGFSQKAGRNSNGKITIRHRGSGHKQAIRQIDWSRQINESIVVGFNYDPQRNVYLAKLYNKKTAKSVTSANYTYIVAPAGVKLFQKLISYGGVSKTDPESNQSSTNKLLQAGDVAPLFFFETGDFIHNVSAFSGQKPIFARSAGTFCQIRSLNLETSTKLHQEDISATKLWVKVRLPSGSQRLIDNLATATSGIVAEYRGNLSKQKRFNIGKAGRSRWLGWRPSVRGVARNPVDHPHGGGQGKTSGGRPSVTFKSWPTKGQPTRSPKRKNSLIITSRKNKK